MKIKRDDKTYLQESDVIFIHRNSMNPPKCFLNEVWDNDGRVAIYDDKRGGVDFVYCFGEPESRKWIDSQEFLMDYEILSEKSPSEIEDMISEAAKKLTMQINAFSDLLGDDKDAYLDRHNLEIAKLSYAIGSLLTLKEHLEGKLEFMFPKEISKDDSEWFLRHYKKDAE